MLCVTTKPLAVKVGSSWQHVLFWASPRSCVAVAQSTIYASVSCSKQLVLVVWSVGQLAGRGSRHTVSDPSPLHCCGSFWCSWCRSCTRRLPQLAAIPTFLGFNCIVLCASVRNLTSWCDTAGSSGASWSAGAAHLQRMLLRVRFLVPQKHCHPFQRDGHADHPMTS